MAGFGLPMPGDFNARSQQAMDGAGRATGQMVNLHNINSSNALQHQNMMLNEAYRRDELAQRLNLNERNFQANRPGVLDNIGMGLTVLNTGAQAWNALSGDSGASLFETVASLWAA